MAGVGQLHLNFSPSYYVTIIVGKNMVFSTLLAALGTIMPGSYGVESMCSLHSLAVAAGFLRQGRAIGRRNLGSEPL